MVGRYREPMGENDEFVKNRWKSFLKEHGFKGKDWLKWANAGNFMDQMAAGIEKIDWKLFRMLGNVNKYRFDNRLLEKTL